MAGKRRTPMHCTWLLQHGTNLTRCHSTIFVYEKFMTLFTVIATTSDDDQCGSRDLHFHFVTLSLSSTTLLQIASNKKTHLTNLTMFPCEASDGVSSSNDAIFSTTHYVQICTKSNKWMETSPATSPPGRFGPREMLRNSSVENTHTEETTQQSLVVFATSFCSFTSTNLTRQFSYVFYHTGSLAGRKVVSQRMFQLIFCLSLFTQSRAITTTYLSKRMRCCSM